jgi:hypothetical protein
VSEELKVINNGPMVEQEASKELSKWEQKKLQKQKEKEEARQKAYANSMISRAEAYQMASQIAMQQVQQLSDILRDPIRANLAHTMAVIELLKDKGIIKDEGELNNYYSKVLQAVLKPEEEREQEETEVQE